MSLRKEEAELKCSLESAVGFFTSEPPHAIPVGMRTLLNCMFWVIRQLAQIRLDIKEIKEKQDGK